MKTTKPSQEHLFQVEAAERFQRELAEANGELIEWDISDLLNEEEEMSNTVEVGSKVSMVNDLPAQWFKNRSKGYPTTLTGTVLKVFKNGKVSVRVKELDNKAMHYKLSDLKLR